MRARIGVDAGDAEHLWDWLGTAARTVALIDALVGADVQATPPSSAAVARGKPGGGIRSSRSLL